MTEGIRRTVTIEKDIHSALQKFRGKLMIQGVEKNFTDVVNEWLRFGLQEKGLLPKSSDKEH